MTGLEWFLVILAILILAGDSRGIGGGGGYQPRPLSKGAKLVPPPQGGSGVWMPKP